MDFWEVIYENVKKKKKTFRNIHLYIRFPDILKFYEVLICIYCKGLFYL